MRFTEPLIPGILIERHHRFLAEAQLDDGSVVTAHTPNTGSMRGCAEPGCRIWLSRVAGGGRKYPYRWELLETSTGVLVGVDPTKANRLAEDAILDGKIPELQAYGETQREVRATHGSRIDLLLKGGGERPDCWLEVKSVTWVEGSSAYFPDAVSRRATRHLQSLSAIAECGERAVLLFCVQRADAVQVAPAVEVDPAYAAALRQAAGQGVELLAYAARVTLEGISLEQRLAVSGAGTITDSGIDPASPGN